MNRQIFDEFADQMAAFVAQKVSRARKEGFDEGYNSLPLSYRLMCRSGHLIFGFLLGVISSSVWWFLIMVASRPSQ